MSNMNKIYAKPNQTLWDISLEQFGSIEAVFELLVNNEQIDSVNYNIETAEEINISNKEFDVDVLNFYKTRGIHPASNYVQEDSEENKSPISPTNEDMPLLFCSI